MQLSEPVPSIHVTTGGGGGEVEGGGEGEVEGGGDGEVEGGGDGGNGST